VTDRERPELSCGEWHGDGTAGEDDCGSVLTVMAPAQAMGGAVQVATILVGKSPKGLRQLQNSILRLSRLAWQVATILKEDRVVILARMRHLWPVGVAVTTTLSR
jgi:hypothetical protein